MAVVTMRQLLEAGVHFGHQTRRWNPKMKRYILTDRNSIYIIDLQKTLTDIDRTYDFVKETVAHGGSILFVGTKKQAQEAIQEQAERVGMPYVNQRWLGGMLTNFSTVSKRLSRMKELEQIDFDDVASSGRTKKELLMMRREKDKLVRTLGGIRDMNKVPSAVWVIDTNKEHLAVAEANKLGIPVVAILDTNCDPDEVTYPIPGNDDAIGSVSLLTRVIADAVAEGLVARGKAAAGTEDAADEQPMPEWEREILAAGQDSAEADAAEATEAQKAGEEPKAEADGDATPADEAKKVDEKKPAKKSAAKKPAAKKAAKEEKAEAEADAPAEAEEAAEDKPKKATAKKATKKAAKADKAEEKAEAEEAAPAEDGEAEKAAKKPAKKATKKPAAKKAEKAEKAEEAEAEADAPAEAEEAAADKKETQAEEA